MHDHKHGYQLHAFVGRRGVWVNRHGDWDRPLHVWLYRGAWRVICWPCATSLQSDVDLLHGGWPSQSVAFDAAYVHCGGCQVAPLTVRGLAVGEESPDG